MYNKFEKLKNYLNRMNEERQGICLAFSGGIDSTLLLYLCRDLNLTAVTFKSAFQTGEEIAFTRKICEKFNIMHIIKEFNPLEHPELKNNPKNRCYLCKKLFFKELKSIAGRYLAIDGTNFDDLSAYRPGIAALGELDIISPLAGFKISKSEIRSYAKELGIEIFDKPSTPCLATRFPYGTELTKEKLFIAENGEKLLENSGFKNNRLRIHGDIARIEIPQADFGLFLQKKALIINGLKNLGLKYITLDTEGLRSGSMED